VALLACTLFGSGTATQINLPGVNQHFYFYSVHCKSGTFTNYGLVYLQGLF